MKKILVTLLLLVTGVTVFAQSKRAILRVHLSDESPLTVTIDNRVYDKHGRSITIGDLPAGRHYLKVYEYKSYRDGGGHATLLFSGNVRTKRNTVTTCVVNPNDGSARVKSTSMDYEDEWNDRRDEEQYTPGRSNMLTGRDMDDLKKRVEKHITDTDRMKLMKSVLGNKSYYTAQVQNMMGWLSFESTKLEFAKWAFKNVADTKDYWKLESEFSFSSTKNEFNDYIQGKN